MTYTARDITISYDTRTRDVNHVYFLFFSPLRRAKNVTPISSRIREYIIMIIIIITTERIRMLLVLPPRRAPPQRSSAICLSAAVRTGDRNRFRSLAIVYLVYNTCNACVCVYVNYYHALETGASVHDVGLGVCFFFFFQIFYSNIL